MNAYEYISDIICIELYSLCQNANVANLEGGHSLRTVLESRARKARNLKPSIRRTKLKTSSEKWSCWNRKNEAVLNQIILKLNIVLEDYEKHFSPPQPPLPPRKGYTVRYARTNVNGSRTSFAVASVRSSIH